MVRIFGYVLVRIGYGFLYVFGHVQVRIFVRIGTYFSAYICSQWHVSGTFRYVSGTYNGTYLARFWVRILRSSSDPIPLLVHALFGAAPLPACSRLLNPVPASALRFLHVIHCFSSRQLRRHGRQLAPPQQQSSSRRRPLWRRCHSLRRLRRSLLRLGGCRRCRPAAVDAVPVATAASGGQQPAAAAAAPAASIRRHRRRPAAESAPS